MKKKGQTENKKNKENKKKNSDGIAEHKHVAMGSLAMGSLNTNM